MEWNARYDYGVFIAAGDDAISVFYVNIFRLWHYFGRFNCGKFIEKTKLKWAVVVHFAKESDRDCETKID